jgi:hypothetical protein
MRDKNPTAKGSPDQTLRWVRRGSALAVLVIGWLFILIQNNFHITAPVVFVCLGYLAGVAAIYTLFRTGASAMNQQRDDHASWGVSLGALGELEREKRSLLKAIKEAEFDLQMGKLSPGDAESMIQVYRQRAIEVIKEIDILNTATGSAGTVRDRILREARARIEIEQKSKDSLKTVDDKKTGDKQKKRAAKLAAAISSTKAPVVPGDIEQPAKPDEPPPAANEPETNAADAAPPNPTPAAAAPPPTPAAQPPAPEAAQPPTPAAAAPPNPTPGAQPPTPEAAQPPTPAAAEASEGEANDSKEAAR